MRTGRKPRCDLFCSVVDNYGDAGVCWRLALELATVSGWSVRLVIDRPEILSGWCLPSTNGASGTAVGNVEIVDWTDPTYSAEVSDIVIEAFGCRLPDCHVQAMRARKFAPVWINLEYLSAEDWVESCHGLPSPDPETGLAKHFFFPGFTERTGGVLRERGFEMLALEFQSPARRLDFLTRMVGPVDQDDIPISVFCYAGSALSELIATSGATHPEEKRPLWLLTEPVAKAGIDLPAGATDRIRVLPFLTQPDYDRLLLSCALNFVRGEDSFVRAQHATRPFVWQAYRQQDDTHLIKLDAFLTRYLAKAPDALREVVRSVWVPWNCNTSIPEVAWKAFLQHAPAIEAHNQQWSECLGSMGSLAENLAKFCESRL